MNTQYKKLNQVITGYFIMSALIVLLSFMISCKKEDKIKLNDIDGTWADNNWQYGLTGAETDTLIWVFDSEEKNAILQTVPVNAFGFEANDIAIRSINKRNRTSLEAEGLIKYAGSDNEEWVELIIERVDSESISLEYDCPSCGGDNASVLTRQ